MIYTLSGGGSELNLKVVGGTSEPSTPKENTVWVNTSADILSWDISIEQPHRRSINKNLLVYPYFYSGATTKNGVTFTVNSDGTVSVNGTASAGTSFQFSYQKNLGTEMLLEAGTYTISGGTSAAAIVLRYSYDNWGTTADVQTAASATTFTLTKPARAYAFIWVPSGTVCTGLVYKPQIEKGTTATDFVKGDATGQVWVQTAAAGGGISVNALAKNGLWLDVRGARQYIAGAWTSKDTALYHAGEWHELTGSLVLYDADTGVDNTAVTGGIRYDTYSGSSSDPQHQTGFAATYTGTGYFGLSTDNAIDLSGYNTLHMTVVVANSNLQYQNAAGVLNEDLSLYSALGTGATNFAAYKTLTSGINTLSIPVSSLSGSHVLGIAVGCSSSNTITLKHLSLE